MFYKNNYFQLDKLVGPNLEIIDGWLYRDEKFPFKFEISYKILDVLKEFDLDLIKLRIKIPFVDYIILN